MVIFEVWVAGRAARPLSAIYAKTVTAALQQAKDIPMSSVMLPWTPSNPGPGTFARVSNPHIFLSTAQNGKLMLAMPEPVDVNALLT